MATTGVLTGGSVYLQADIAGGTSYVTIACATDVSYEVTNDLIEKICMSQANDGVDYTSGLVRWTASITGLLALDSTLGGMDFHALVLSGAKFALKVVLGGTTGDDYITGDVIVSSLTYTGVNKGGLNTWNATFQGCEVPATGTEA